MPASFLVRVVFGLLVIATLGAFGLTQRLKSATPPIERVLYPRFISPNGDGRKDTVAFRFRLTRPDRVTASVIDAEGTEVRRLVDDARLGTGLERRVWDGRTDAGRVAPEGEYRMRVVLRDQGRTLTAPRTLVLDTTPPVPAIVRVSPSTLVPGAGRRRGRARIRYRGPSDPAPAFGVYRTDGDRPVRVRAFRGPRFRQTAEWDGRTDGGRPAPDGTYAFAVRVRDEAGNLGRSPRSGPPGRSGAPPRTGATVRRLSLRAPLAPVAPGDDTRLVAGPVPGGFSWTLSRLGATRPLARGRMTGRTLRLRVPPQAATGLHLVRLRGRGQRAVAPLVVRGGRPAPVLVVLPALTWQGENRVDGDRDGFPDTLVSAATVSLLRPFAGLPEGLVDGAAPVLRALDRERRVYDLTTDAALARGVGPALSGRAGVLVAGTARWLPDDVLRGLREHVGRGGALALIGPDSLHRSVEARPTRLTLPSPRRPRGALGERTRVVPGRARVRITRDRLRLFPPAAPTLGPFTGFESSLALPAGARSLTAGRPIGHRSRPVLVAYRLGRGTVIRAGVDGFGRALERGRGARPLTRRLWTVLSR